jgi:hypothetical protein
VQRDVMRATGTQRVPLVASTSSRAFFHIWLSGLQAVQLRLCHWAGTQNRDEHYPWAPDPQCKELKQVAMCLCSCAVHYGPVS